ncbi:MAG: DUF3540 domain-containing protein [Myxococcales bacterium]|nr:DUF3540 domain-containing protein [Myxococcales bacterium]
MSKLARIRNHRTESRAAEARPELASAPSAPALGPAEVVAVGPGRVEVALPGGVRATARLALAYLYEPAVGDEVLVIGHTAGHYVIGVLRGRGRAVLEVPGDLDVHAVGGTLRLRGDRGVCLEGREVEVRASKLELVAAAVTETFTSLRQRVSELWSVRAGQTHTVVDGSSYTQAKSAAILSEERVTINGKAIHLG